MDWFSLWLTKCTLNATLGRKSIVFYVVSDAENDHYHNEDKMQRTRIYITIPIVSEKGSFIYICEPLLLFPHWADFIRKNIASSAYPIRPWRHSSQCYGAAIWGLSIRVWHQIHWLSAWDFSGESEVTNVWRPLASSPESVVWGFLVVVVVLVVIVVVVCCCLCCCCRC